MVLEPWTIKMKKAIKMATDAKIHITPKMKDITLKIANSKLTAVASLLLPSNNLIKIFSFFAVISTSLELSIAIDIYTIFTIFALCFFLRIPTTFVWEDS